VSSSSLRDSVVAVQGGDPSAWVPIVDDFLPTAIGLAYGHTGDIDCAREVANEAFAIAIEQVRSLRDPAAFAGWFAAIVRTAAARDRRQTRRGTLDEVPGPAPATEDLVVEADEAQRLRDAVEKLAVVHRIPIVLHYFAGLSLAAIADLCDAPLSTVKQRMRVARRKLAEGMVLVEGLNRVAQVVHDEAGNELIRLFCAVRARDAAEVARLLDARPDLVDAREQFTTSVRNGYRLALNDGGTPLLRAIEFGDDAIARLLLDRGADPNGACACAGGESPLWTAVVHRRTAIVSMLLAAGADSSRTAFGSTPADVARMRGYGEILTLLGEIASAQRSSTSTIAATDDDVWWTGIRAVDLWCPLPNLASGPGLGAMVLVAELSLRAANATSDPAAVRWAGFVAAPLVRGDFEHALAELGIPDRVQLDVARHDESHEGQLRELDRVIAEARTELLVVFDAPGFTGEIEARLPLLASRSGLTIVVALFDSESAQPVGSPYRASIALDPARASRRQFPAVGPIGSWSKVATADSQRLAQHAQALLAAGGPAADELQSALAQPFFCAEPFTGIHGQWTSREDLPVELGL
jgi:RNA polymerase sigma-70 factor, ECF subfamily